MQLPGSVDPHHPTPSTGAPLAREHAVTGGWAFRPATARGRLLARCAALPLVLGVAAGLAACDGTDTSPLSPAGSVPAFSADAAPAAGSLANWSATTEAALRPLLAQEQARIALNLQHSKAGVPSHAAGRVSAQAGKGKGKGGPPFLACTPQGYAADTRIIGPAGGQLSIGRHRLVIPAGALTQPTVITGETPASEIASVVLSPHGLRFLVPATVTIDYKHCRTPGKPSETVAYYDEAFNILEWPETKITGFRAHAQIWHFSIYGMSSGRQPE